MFQSNQQRKQFLLEASRLLLLLFTFVAAAAGQAPSSTTAPLADAKAIHNEAKRRQARDSYSYKVFTKSWWTEHGRIEIEVSELSELYKPQTDGNVSYPIPVVVLEKNGKPLSEKNIAKQRTAAAKQLAEYESRSGGLSGSGAKKTKVYPPLEASLLRFPFYRFRENNQEDLDNMEFSHLRTEMLDGRECYVYIWRYRSDANLEAYEKEWRRDVKTTINIIEKIIWVDVADKQFSRMERYSRKRQQAKDYIDKPLAEREKIFYGITKFNRTEDGLWLMASDRSFHRDDNGAIDRALEYFFSDYKIFTTEIKDVKVNGARSSSDATKEKP